MEMSPNIYLSFPGVVMVFDFCLPLPVEMVVDIYLPLPFVLSHQSGVRQSREKHCVRILQHTHTWIISIVVNRNIVVRESRGKVCYERPSAESWCGYRVMEQGASAVCSCFTGSDCQPDPTLKYHPGWFLSLKTLQNLNVKGKRLSKHGA